MGVYREQEENGMREGHKDGIARGEFAHFCVEGILSRVLSWDIIWFILDHSTV